MTARKWPLVLGLTAGLAALGAGFAAGPDTLTQWQLAARWTARAGFPLLILTYLASSLVTLWPSDMTRALLRDRRWWGLGFAASHTVHLVALVTYLRISGEAKPLPVLIGGGGAYVMLYLMALTSSRTAQRAMGRSWPRLHTIGIHWLWGVFAFSYLGRAFRPETMLTGATFGGIALAALALRIMAARMRRQRRAGQFA
jgi:DMSO/TMAO reductase YedYZ heme-binding membrane subunit